MSDPRVSLGLFTTLLALVWCAGAQVQIDPTVIFTPDAPVNVVLNFDNYTRILVREGARVALNCSIVRDRFIASQEEIDPSRVTVRWLFRTELPQRTIQQVTGVVMDGDDEGRIRLQGEFNEILNITYIRLPRLALDGTTGEYSCEVCQDEAQCVNSTIPVLGRNHPPDIDDGRPDQSCSVIPFFQLTSCNVGTNYCIDPDDQNIIQLLCFHNASAQPTPFPRIGVWFINGEQVSSLDGSKLPGVTNAISLADGGRRLSINDAENAPRGNYTCQLTNIAGSDSATTIINECGKNPPDIRDGEPDGTCIINPMLRITTCDIGTDFSINPDDRLRSLRLQCQQNASAPPTPEPLTGVWFLNGEQISSREDGSKLPGVTNAVAIDDQGKGLRIIDFENAPRGNYTCQLMNSIGADTATTIISDRIIPGEPPEIITDPLSPEGIVTIGNSACFNESILVNCSLRAGTRPVMYEWTRDGETIPAPSPAHLLRVNRPGNYSCAVMNSFGQDTASSVVRGHPVVDLITTVIGARNGGGCDRLNPRPRGVDICPFAWETVTFICRHDADRLSSLPSILTPYGPGPSQFYLNNCSGVLDGHYSCSSSNECGTASRSVRLQVFYPAKIDRHVEVPESAPNVTHIGAGQIREPVRLFAGGHAVLYCPSSGAEQPQTRWFRRGSNNTLIPVSNTNHTILNTTTIQSVTTLVLSLPSLRQKDFGEYLCIVHNRAGRDEARVILREIGVWHTDEWSMCAHRRRVTCIGTASGQQLNGEEACSDVRPARVSQCTF